VKRKRLRRTLIQHSSRTHLSKQEPPTTCNGYFSHDYEFDNDDLVDIKKSCLHNIATRPTIIPYYDMVWWIISHDDTFNSTIVNSARKIVGSFRIEYISNMYKLGLPKVFLDGNFINSLIEKEVEKE
jgi:hypothetical protein